MLSLHSEVCKFCKIFEIAGRQEHINLCRFFIILLGFCWNISGLFSCLFGVYFQRDCKGSFSTHYIIMFTGSLRGDNSCQLVAPSSPKSNRGNLLCLARLSSHTETGFLLFDCVAPLGLFICSFYPPFPLWKHFLCFFTSWFSFSPLSLRNKAGVLCVLLLGCRVCCWWQSQ